MGSVGNCSKGESHASCNGAGSKLGKRKLHANFCVPSLCLFHADGRTSLDSTSGAGVPLTIICCQQPNKPRYMPSRPASRWRRPPPARTLQRRINVFLIQPSPFQDDVKSRHSFAFRARCTLALKKALSAASEVKPPALSTSDRPTASPWVLYRAPLLQHEDN